MRLRVVLAGSLLVVVATGARPISGKTAIPGVEAKVQAAIVQQRRALRALPHHQAQPTRRNYARAQAHVRKALSALHAVESKLTAEARKNGPFPHIRGIEQRLDAALADDGYADTRMDFALFLLGRGVSPGSTPAAQARTHLHHALTESAALAKLLH